MALALPWGCADAHPRRCGTGDGQEACEQPADEPTALCEGAVDGTPLLLRMRASIDALQLVRLMDNDVEAPLDYSPYRLEDSAPLSDQARFSVEGERVTLRERRGTKQPDTDCLLGFRMKAVLNLRTVSGDFAEHIPGYVTYALRDQTTFRGELPTSELQGGYARWGLPEDGTLRADLVMHWTGDPEHELAVRVTWSGTLWLVFEEAGTERLQLAASLR